MKSNKTKPKAILLLPSYYQMISSSIWSDLCNNTNKTARAIFCYTLKTLVVLIYSKLYSKSSYYLYQFTKTKTNFKVISIDIQSNPFSWKNKLFSLLYCYIAVWFVETKALYMYKATFYHLTYTTEASNSNFFSCATSPVWFTGEWEY